MSLTDEVVAELVKVRQVFHTILSKIHLPSETEINEIRDFVNTIGGSQVGAEGTTAVTPVEVAPPALAPTPAAPVAQGITPVAPDPLAGFSADELAAELAKRQGPSATGQN